MLKFSNLLSKTATIGEYPVAGTLEAGFVSAAVSLTPSLDGFLKLDSNRRFFAFDYQVWVNLTQKCNGFYAGHPPNMLWSMPRVALTVIVAVPPSAVFGMDRFNHWEMGNGDVDVKLHLATRPIANMGVLGVGYSNHALTVKQSSNVPQIEFFHRALDEKSANSVDTQTGQYRAKQDESPGACRDHVPTPKGKIWSDLHRNMQRLAEMTSRLRVFIGRRIRVMLTDCNSKYLFFRPYRGRNFVALGDERMSTNQDAVVRLLGFAGNMTASGPQFSGVAIE